MSSQSPEPNSHTPALATLAMVSSASSQGMHRAANSTSPPPPAPDGPSNGKGAGKKRARGPVTVADTLAATMGSKKERKRQRVHLSCAECYRRKHKCDRNIPCQPCIDRGLADACRAFEQGDQFGDVRDRVARLEDLVEGIAAAQAGLAREFTEAKNQFATQTLVMANANGPSVDEIDELEDEESGDGSRRPRKKRMLSYVATRSGMEREELLNAESRGGPEGAMRFEDTQGNREDHEPHNPLEGGLTKEGDSWYGALALPSVSRGVIETEIRGERLELGANLPRYPASVKLNRLIYEGGAPKTILSDLMAALPPREVTDDLLVIYFRDINQTRLPFHEGTFRASYDDLMAFRWGNAREEQGDDGARHMPFLAFLFIILAVAKLSEPVERISMNEAKKGAMKLYHACRRTIAVASIIRVDHIDLVLAHLFAARFLTVQRQSAESWSMLGFAIRAAQAIGLHRDGSKLGLDAVTTERRRRLWALLIYMDKTTAILLGRPPGIQDSHTDTLPPSDIDIDTLPRAAPPHAPRMARAGQPPGVFNFVAIRHKLTGITGSVVEHFQVLNHPRKYADVLRLDNELEKFLEDLPPPYRSETREGYDRSFDKICPWLPLHRYLINVEFHYIRIALHRPYVLRNSDKYSHSRTVAFASARQDRVTRLEYRRDVSWPPDRATKVHMGGLYRLFNASMMIGIALILDPSGPEAPQFMSYLEEFVTKHKHRETQDQCSKREVKIIELFIAKARDPSWCAATATGALSVADAQASVTAKTIPNAGPAADPSAVASTTYRPGTAASDASTPLSSRPLQPLNNPLAETSSMDAPMATHSPTSALFFGHAPSGAPSNLPPSQATPEEGTSWPSSIDTDLAQSLFDQLGGFESFGFPDGLFGAAGSGGPMSAGMASTPGAAIFGNPNAPTGGASTTATDGFDFGGPVGDQGVWSASDRSASGASAGAYFVPTPSATKGRVGSVDSSTSQAFSVPVASGSRPASALSALASQAVTMAGRSAPALAPTSIGENFNGSVDGTASQAKSSDWGLVPWGGLIEAIVTNGPSAMAREGSSSGNGGALAGMAGEEEGAAAGGAKEEDNGDEESAQKGRRGKAKGTGRKR